MNTRPPFNEIANDIFRKSIELFFDDDFFGTGDLCEGAIACFVFNTTDRPPDEPVPPPYIVFNPDFSDEPGVVAGVLAHEGTHLGQYLDETTFNEPSVFVTEFPAFWNAAVYWREVREQFGPPYDTDLEEQVEFVYQTALDGEAAMRELIRELYS